MEARISFLHVSLRSALVTKLTFALICVIAMLWSSTVQAQRHYQVSSKNFVVHAPDANLAKAISTKAEIYRKQLSLEWLGYEIPTWAEKCPIQVELAMQAGGETSFAFVTRDGRRGEPVSWQMRIFGPPSRLLDAVLPHEVTHTIFATHFGRPLPRWADEGACTTVEHSSEREKNHRMLLEFLTSSPSRGIPFNRMFVMREYPHDILPLYAQGYSLAKFLIGQKGKRHFIKYIESGLEKEVRGREIKAWDRATDEYYGFENLSELQIEWISWVRNGSRLPMQETFTASQANDSNGMDSSGLNRQSDANWRPSPLLAEAPESSWYVQQARQQASTRIAAKRQSLPAEPASIGNRAKTSRPLPGSSPVREGTRTSTGLRSRTIWR